MPESSRPKSRIKHLTDSQLLKWKICLHTEFQHAFRLAICVLDKLIVTVAQVSEAKHTTHAIPFV